MIENSRLVGNIRKRSSYWLLIILTAYLLLAAGYSITTPLFEAPDEQLHYFTIKEIALNNRLPTTADGDNDFTGQEAAQPPLYYLLTSLISRLFGESKAYDALWPNPLVRLGIPGSLQNVNAFIHGPAEEWPWHGYALEAHLIRLLSSFAGLGTLLCIFAASRLLWPDAPELALLSTALVGFLPQFDFIHGAITNDVLIILICSLCLWQLLHMWYRGMSWRRQMLLGITLGAAILTKTAGLLLFFFSLAFLTVIILKEGRNNTKSHLFRNWLYRISLVTLITVLISGWSLWRNWQLYGDITATNQHLLFMGDDRQYSIFDVLAETSGLWDSLFAVFGWFNIIPYRWVYWVWNGLVIVSAVGFIQSVIWRRRPGLEPSERPLTLNQSLRNPRLLLSWPGLPVLFLGLWVFMVYGGLVSFMMQVPAAQGRLMFPTLLPLSMALSYGLTRFRWSGVILAAPVLALLTSVYCLFWVIPPAYSQPTILTEAEIPETATMHNLSLGKGLILLASEIETTEAVPGEDIWLTLFWQVDKDLNGGDDQEAPMEVLELLGRGNLLVGKVQSYHGRGLYPANLWTVGDVVEDRLAIRVNSGTSTPGHVRINLKLVGETESIDVGIVKITPFEWPDLSNTAVAQLNGFQLINADYSPKEARPGDRIEINLEWQVQTPTTGNLATFVHLGDPTKPPLTQGDSLPLGGYYPTWLWESGERFMDQYNIEIPQDLAPGIYPILIGMYDPIDGARLPLAVGGDRQLNDAYHVGSLVVTP